MKVRGIFTAIILMMASFCSAKAAPAPAESAQSLKLTTSRSRAGVLNFSIPSSSFKKVQFTIYNESGAVVSSEERAASDLQVDVKALKADGTYTFAVVAGGKTYSSRALIML